MIDVKRYPQRYLDRSTPLYASTLSLAACVVLAVGSLLIGLVERSLLIQTNGLLALIDIGNSILFLAAVDRSSRSADLTFNYGYGKYESLAVLVSANLLIATTIMTLINSVSLFEHPPEASNTLLLGGWSVVSFFIMRTTARRLVRYAGRFHQPMLEYDAALWKVDSLVELAVIAGVLVNGVAQLAGLYQAAVVIDGALSIGLVLFTLKTPLQHGKEAFRQLLDRTLPDTMQYDVLAVIAQNTDRMCEFTSVHTRRSGRDIFIEVDLIMPYDYTLEQLYVLEEDMIEGLRSRFPTAVPRVYVQPCDRSCALATGTMCPVKKQRQNGADPINPGS